MYSVTLLRLIVSDIFFLRRDIIILRKSVEWLSGVFLLNLLMSITLNGNVLMNLSLHEVTFRRNIINHLYFYSMRNSINDLNFTIILSFEISLSHWLRIDGCWLIVVLLTILNGILIHIWILSLKGILRNGGIQSGGLGWLFGLGKVRIFPNWLIQNIKEINFILNHLSVLTLRLFWLGLDGFFGFILDNWRINLLILYNSLLIFLKIKLMILNHIIYIHLILLFLNWIIILVLIIGLLLELLGINFCRIGILIVIFSLIFKILILIILSKRLTLILIKLNLISRKVIIAIIFII